MNASPPFEPFEIIDGNRTKGLVLVADHAKRLLPAEYGTLGLPASEFERHIAYDIGIEALTRSVARLTGAPAVMAGYSRLLIDPNRGLADPTIIRQIYDRTIIPGNYPLPEDERRKRIGRYYLPYHNAVAAMIETTARESGRAPFVISLHSFTREMFGRQRPWHAGILWDSDPRAPKRLLERLRAEPGLVIGDNEPYDGALPGDTMYYHCTARGLPHALIEVRQDLVSEQRGIDEWARRIATAIDAINREPDIHVITHHPSRFEARRQIEAQLRAGLEVER